MTPFFADFSYWCRILTPFSSVGGVIVEFWPPFSVSATDVEFWGHRVRPSLPARDELEYPPPPPPGVVTLRLPSAIVESPWRHKRVPFVNIASGRSRSIKRRQWKHKMDYYGVVFAHLATGRGINAKDPSGLDSDRWIPHSRCCENPARAKALAGFSRHLSAGFTDLNPAPRGLSLYNLMNYFAV